METVSAKDLCIKGLLTALVAVATMSIAMPIPATSGYIHLGDSVIFIASVFFGWQYGLVAGAVGSMFADIFMGYSHWAPFTLIIKGLMGLIVGKIANYSGAKGNFFSIRNMLGPLLGGLWMVFGYLIGGTILKGSFLVALTSVPANLLQAIGGFILFIVIGTALNKGKIYKYISVK